jgi:hypothetical protein
MISTRLRRLGPLLAALALTFASGCYATVRARPVYVQPVATATVTTAPAPQGVVVYQAPPAPRATVSVRPAAPWAGAVWVQGNWQWNGAQYVWVQGRWLQPRAGAVYVQPRWQRRGRGYVYVQGSWRGNGRGRTVRRQRVQRRRVNRRQNRRQNRRRGRTMQQQGGVTVQVR